MSEYVNNRAKRQEVLKGLLRQLHEGRTVEEVKGEFAALLAGVSATEIAELEQALIAEGLPETEIKRLCDVHVAVFRESLDAQTRPETVPGHPVHTFRAENAAAAKVLDALQAALEALKVTPGAAQLERARERLQQLREYEKHYLRKENVLFPYLERHGFSGPSSVMWAIHDDVRAGWKALEALLAAGPGENLAAFNARLDEIFGPLSTAIREMFYKEDTILFPTALQMLTQEEWTAIHAQEPEVGYCYVEPGGQAPPEVAPPPVTAPAPAEGQIPLNTGALTVQEVNWMLTHLPVDITYVDRDDVVRFFSETRERIFPRSPAIIGRKVQQCHPPASVHRVQRILDDFRAGRRDVAEFWIQMGPADAGGKFVLIRYFALRDERGVYQGTLEVTQDIAHIRTLEGERRLLDEGE